MSIFTGSGVAIVTPFNKTGINYDVLGQLIEYHIENNTDCIVVCGTTGESATMTETEHLECIKYTIDKVNKRIPVIAGTGSNNSEHAAFVTKKAYDYGADGALVVTPYYNKTTQKGLKEHYTYIAKNADIPIILYNVPSRTGLAIKPNTAAELSKIDNIIGIKDASGNISAITEMMQLTNGCFDVYSGNDDQIVPILSLGGKGVISVVANILPKETHNLVKNYINGDTNGSLALQLKMFKLIKSLFCEVNPIPIKTALNLLGFNVGHCRMPLTSMEECNLRLLKQAMTDYGFKI